jgi:menaquinone-9 beta-reductase
VSRVIVVGGGPSGAALATLLARAGRDVTLLERDSGPADKVCGEFLSGEACDYLDALGVDPEALGAVPIERVRLCGDRAPVESALPFRAKSLTRRVLDEALLQSAERAGANVRRGVKVRRIAREPGGWSLTSSHGEQLVASHVFLAVGKHDVSTQKRGRGLQNELVAFKTYWELDDPERRKLDTHVELIPFQGGYAGLQPVENGRANLCLVVEKAQLARVGNNWPSLLESLQCESAHLTRRLHKATPCLAKPLALSAIPYGYVCHGSDGLWRLGDQAAVIPSFSGDGMSIALHSAFLAAKVYLEGGSPETFQRRLGRDVARQVKIATALSLGLVHTSAQALMLGATRHWPDLVRLAATQTRLSPVARSACRA